MHNHAPENYKCPICLAIEGIENSDTLIKQSDIVYKDELATVFIGSFSIGSNPPQPIIVPNKHFENLYDLPTEYARHIQDLAQKVALAVRENYPSEGVMIQQNNEPASGQHAFHYHMHIFPRYENDNIHQNMTTKKNTTPEQRQVFVEKLKTFFKK